MLTFRSIFNGCIATLVVANFTVVMEAEDRVDYARDVLPILSDKCYHCHGPDENARKGKLRLDQKDMVLGVGQRKGAVIPHKPELSRLVERTSSRDPDVMMPPPDSKRTLTAQQVQILRRWVEQGANWGQHWAFVAPIRCKPPNVQRQDWVQKNDIDRFIFDRLAKEGLQPSPPAEPGVLLRRLSLDLTGLPPTPIELQDFLAEYSRALQAPTKPAGKNALRSSPHSAIRNPQSAIESAIDRLLASPRFGERMASEWLDVARFADTHGYQMDRYRPMWQYRDWVINAFNRNLPFDQFTIWQLAGDLLPNATQEQKLATAFNRLHLQNEEGGVVEEEFRVAYVSDRVNTFATAFLGLTVECARCHDHKYDPISQKDYYSLFAFFQNIDECGQTSYFTSSMPVPTVLLSTPEQDAKLQRIREKIAAKEKEIAASAASADGAFTEWLKHRPRSIEPTGTIARFDFDVADKNQIANAVDAKHPGNLHENPKSVSGKFGKALELDGENGVNFPGLGTFSRADPFSLSIWIKPGLRAPRQVVLHHSRAPVDAGSRGYELLLEDGRVAFGMHHMWPGNSLKVRTKSEIPQNKWTHVAIAYNGSSKALGLIVFVNGKLADREVIRDGLWKEITYESGEPDLAIGHRFRDNGFKGGAVDDFRIFNRTLTELEAAQLANRNEVAAVFGKPTVQLSSDEKKLLRDLFDSSFNKGVVKAKEELHALRIEESKLINPITEVMGMVEMPIPKPAFILKRGAYDMPLQPVVAATPAALPPFPEKLPRNRLGLAKWLTAPNHPLTARVTVNRVWQMLFGKGLVETSENFGSQGAQPTHPELLDWLAVDFVEHGWDLKRLIKTIVTSATYQQSSRVSPELLAKDPNNRWLARMSARRLTAEMLRDQALFAGGLLTEKVGGPSVRPYQPAGLWEVSMSKPNYDQAHGPDLYRRTLYTYLKRTVLHPSLATFDAADRSICSVRRQSTNTPMQALAMLNDPQIVEAARFMGQRILTEGGTTTADRCHWGFRLVADQTPTEKELSLLAALFEEQRAEFSKTPLEADKLLAVGEAKPNAELAKPDLAAATVLGLALLNHDAAATRK